MPTTVNTNVCNNFTASPANVVNFTNFANGCVISQKQGSEWPFSPASPITLPCPSTITIKAGLAPGTYGFNVSCCTDLGLKSVTVP